MKVKNQKIAFGVVGLILLGTTAGSIWGWWSENRRANELEKMLSELKVQEKRSAVVRSISKQMEEIAYQQKDISEEQREEAIQQKRTADEMRQRSEIERQNALIAREQAVASEQKAQDARLQAEAQRQIADHQRLQAEFSKRVADTLSYITLGRSLGSLSQVQLQLGNTELGCLLAYASYNFVSRYGGDVYDPSIFQSLMLASQSKRTFARHKGSVTGLSYMSKDDNSMVSVSTFGEIMTHKMEGEQLKSTMLLSNSAYDFRCVYIDNDGTIYAVSRSGHLVVIEGSVPKVIALENIDFPMGITSLDVNSLLVIGEHGLAVYDKQRKMIVETRELDFKMTALSRYDNMPLLFDERGRQHLVKNLNELITTNTPVSGRVTAFASSKAAKLRAYGMSDGTIYLYDEKSNNITKLQGHLSRISRLKLTNYKVMSASYDGTVKFWNAASSKIEPMTLLSENKWIVNFNMDNTKNYVWIGDYYGNITQALISVPMLVNVVRKNLKRDFTPDEWNYYVGKNIPYEKMM